MGVLLIDHRGGQNFDGSKGTKFECDTVPCQHCQAVIAVVLRGCTKQVRSPYRCDRCFGWLCKVCAAAMEQTHTCPGPFRAKVDESLRRAANALDFEYHYRR